jgi:hypothetical protein
MLLELYVPDDELRYIATVDGCAASVGRATASGVRWYALQRLLTGLGQDAFPEPQRIGVSILPLRRRA